MPQNDIRKTFKTNQFRHENVVPNELMTVEFRPSDPSDLTDNPMRMWARTDTGDLYYTVDGVNIAIVSRREDLGYVTPENFGAKGDGVTNDTVAFNNMYNYARANGLSVKLIRPIYRLNSTVDARNVSTYSDLGSILDFHLSAINSSAFRWGGNNVEISGVVFQLSNSTTDTPIQGLYNDSSGSSNQKFINNRVKGLTFKSDGVTGNIYGCWINAHDLMGLTISGNVYETVNYPIQINQQVGGGSILTPLGPPIRNVLIDNNVIVKGMIGVNTPHVYCYNVIINNNTVECDPGLNINLAHVYNFVIDGNILNGETSLDSAIHVEDVSYSGQIVNNVIRTKNNADGVRLQLVSGVSGDPYVPTEGILIANNDIKGVGNARGIQIVDTATRRILVTNNRFENYNSGIDVNALQCDVIDNRFKSLSRCINASQVARIAGMTVESCTEIIRAVQFVEIDGISFYGEVPLLAPVVIPGSFCSVHYRDIRITSANVTATTSVAFNLFVPPITKFNIGMVYKFGNNNAYSTGKYTLNYDGATMTPTKVYEMVGGVVGSSTIGFSGGNITAQHFIGGGGTLNAPYYIQIDSAIYNSQ